MSDTFTLLPYYSLSPSSLTLYELPDRPYYSDKQISSFENLNDNENKYYELSEHSRKRLRKAIDYMIYISKEKNIQGSEIISRDFNSEFINKKGDKYNKPVPFKLSFITLTLSATQHNSDEEIKSKLLNHFLTDLRRKHNVNYYIWKAEKQENGNIHFHILTNRYIPHNYIRESWNSIQNKPGFNYVDIYSKNMQAYFKNGFKSFPNDKRTLSQQKKVYNINKSIKWTNPNSTDIHALYKVKNIQAYLTKYISKSVTKTERVLKMNDLFNELEQYNLLKINTELSQALSFEDDINNEIYDLEINRILSEIDILKKKGVSGRIWAQSQKLSKIKNFVELSDYDHIPDISIVERFNRKKLISDFGNRKLITFYFDITDTPLLQKQLNKHISECANYSGH